MRFLPIAFYSLFLCAALHADPLAHKEFTVNLKDPVFSQGVISTDQGGIVTSEDMRIQAKKISYTNRMEDGVLVQKVTAEGDLLLEYGCKAFVGTRLEYDFVSKTGTVWDGKTFVDIWFLGGERIDLREDGSYFIYNAYVTTSESQVHDWEIRTGSLTITDGHLLSAKNIQFKFHKVQVFWLPSFKSNLRTFSDSPVRYKLTWDKGLGPRATMRYRIYSWEHFNLFFRLDYRLKRGFGGALESDYHSRDHRTTFITKSYGAYDKTVPIERGPRRFRLQGLYHTESMDERTTVHLTYDRLSDNKMVSDFKNEDFEVNTQKRTLLLINHHHDNYFGALSFQPRINRFQSLNQELPLITAGVRPFQLGSSGIISQNYASAGYLDYVFAKELHHYLRNTQSIRLETRNQLYRPFSFRGVTATPSVGIVGLFYSQSPEKHPAGQGILTYGCTVNSRLYRQFGSCKHLVEPYLNFQGYTTPTTPTDHHYIFDITDGYERLNLLRAGVRNLLFTPRLGPFLPSFSADVFTYGFFTKDTSLHRIFPKVYTTLGWNLLTFSIQGGVAYNMAEQVWDYANVQTLWTVNQNLALGVEFRHRSKYDWRKANHENFFIDAARTLENLLDSPLSDGRNTLLTKLHLNITPTLSCGLSSHHGWGRKSEPNYNEAAINFYKMLTASWQLRVSYRYTPDDPLHLTAGISIVK
jgi:hypothetical protein